MSIERLAETLRLVLVLGQLGLFLWMISSGLVRRVPLWTGWLLGELVSRTLFHPESSYWHSLWLPLQPALLFLLAGATLEARWHSGLPLPVLGVSALAIAPVSLGSSLPEIITLRLWLSLGCGLLLLAPASGTSTARWHSVILGILSLATSALSLSPVSGTLWWEFRALYLGLYFVLIVGWWVIFTRLADGDRISS